MTFRFNPFPTLLLNFKPIPSISPKLMNSNHDYPSKKIFFWSVPQKTEVLRILPIEMLELPNFGHMTTFKMQFESYDIVLLMMQLTEIMTS